MVRNLRPQTHDAAPVADIPATGVSVMPLKDGRARRDRLARVKTRRDFAVIMRLATAVLIVGTIASRAQSSPPNHVDLPPLTVEARPLIGVKPADPCVAVDAAARRAGDAGCAAQKLQDAATAAQDHAGQGRDTADIPGATSRDTRIGVANQAATKQRLGNNFGKSVLPQRSTIAPPAPFTRQH